MNRSVFLIFFSILLSGSFVYAQKSTLQINWISFSQLNDSLSIRPKKVFVNFTADWCMYCKVMERTTFKNPEVIKTLNDEYYAVKMNVESTETIVFGEQTFVNKRVKKVNPVHELPLLLASRKNKQFSLPAFVIFDINFIAKSRYFQFLDEEALLSILMKKEGRE